MYTSTYALIVNGAGSVVPSSASGSGTLTDEGGGSLTLSGGLSYSGATTVTDSIFILDSSSSYNISVTGTIADPASIGGTGDTVGTLTLGGYVDLLAADPLNGGTLSFAASLNLIVPATISSAITNSITMAGNASIAAASVQSVTFSGNINTAGHALHFDGTGSVNITGEIYGTSGTVYDDGDGTLTLAGTNLYTGATTVSDSTLILGNSSGSATGTGTVSISGISTHPAYFGGTGGLTGSVGFAAYSYLSPTLGLDINVGALTLSSGTLILPSGSSSMTVNGDITLTASVTVENLTSSNTLTFAGDINITNSAALTADGGNITLAGVIGNSSGNGRIVDEGGSTLTLSNSNTYTGTTTISGSSTLAVGSAYGGSSTGTSNLSIPSGSTLTGSGSITGNLTVASGGTLAPTGPGIINIGNVTLASGSNLDCIINGSTAGTGYSQVSPSSTGTISLNGAHLNLTGTRTIEAGDVLELIQSFTSTPITGTFSGLAQGAQVTVNGVNYAVSYTGGYYGTSFTLTDDTVPAVPTGLSATAGDEQVALNWTATPGATSYGVYEMESGSPVLVDSPTTNSDTITGLTDGTSYAFKVTAIDTAGASSYSSTASATPLPATPTGLTVAAGDTDAFLTWNAVATATSYNIYRNTGGGFALYDSTAVAAYTDTDLTDSSSYSYEVTAVSGIAEGNPSSSVSVTPLATVFTGYTATVVSTNEIDLSWTLSGSWTYIEVDRSTDGINFTSLTTTLSPAATGYNDTSISDGTTYWYRVRALSSGGNSSFTEPQSATTTADVVGLTVTPASSSELDLAWSLNASPQYIEVDSSTNGTSFTALTTTLSGSATSYAVTGLSANTPYWFQVRALFSGGGTSTFTSPVVNYTLPTAPGSPYVAIVSPTQADISWTGNGISTTQYQVFASVNGGTFSAISSNMTNVTNFVYTDLSAGSTIAFEIGTTPSGGSTTYVTTPTIPVVFPDTGNITDVGEAYSLDIPTIGSGEPIDWQIAWGDGGTSSNVSPSSTPFSYTYATAGEYDVAITGTFCGGQGVVQYLMPMDAQQPLTAKIVNSPQYNPDNNTLTVPKINPQKATITIAGYSGGNHVKNPDISQSVAGGSVTVSQNTDGDRVISVPWNAGQSGNTVLLTIYDYTNPNSPVVILTVKVHYE